MQASDKLPINTKQPILPARPRLCWILALPRVTASNTLTDVDESKKGFILARGHIW